MGTPAHAVCAMTRFIALEGRTMFDYSCSRRSFLGLAGGLAAFAGLG
ncbi:hypothetical protein COLSTE_00769, partial [Collinsella stercoris DSM 13279]